ncbi:DUF6252 family protein [Gilvibacter sp. SZ-19]|jgi:hypothetical protein|uniref:DUF6252 family protein n=1 Tax=unclassified Gilvibacter TaxID=2625242 RepID=UPI000B3D3989|nr:DUF6252 family protein [Gilvibacter sp. SZ-19]ARV12498.1 hypothetical protein BTO09_09150 [Gilvibacter sp. SZ-19]
MNTLKVLSRYAFIFMALLVTACDKDDDSSGGGDDPAASGDEFVTAKVDGANFAAAQDPAVIVGAVIDSGVLNVQGGTNSGDTIRITIVGYDGPGTYTSGDNATNPNLMGYFTVSPVAGWLNNGVTSLVDGVGAGTVEVTSDADGVVEGTFSFKGYNAEDMTMKTITEGQFKAIVD